MSTPRTPPGRLHVSSENDISNLDPDNVLSYVGKRHKRPRNDDFTPGCMENPEGLSLRDEILEMLTNWKTDQDRILNKLCSDMADLKKQNSRIQENSDEMDKSMKFISKQYEDLNEKLLSMEQERKENSKYITTLENAIDDLQRRLKFTVIEFRNLPLTTTLNKYESQQDLYELVQKTCGAFETHIQASDIKDVYRITNKTGASTVVTELTSVLTKNKILAGAKEYNRMNTNNKLTTTSIGLPGPSKPVYVTEGLTSKDRKLFALARDKAKTLQYRYCWVNKGRIYMRKAEGGKRVEIKSESYFLALINV